jgi:peptide/nickel transport system permease protein
MLQYIIRRILYAIPLLLAVSFISFFLIVLPPGDYMTTLQASLQNQQGLSREESRRIADEMRAKYGLDKPFIVQYVKWLGGILTGDFGYSFHYRKPVFELIWGRVGLTFLIAFSSFLFSAIGGVVIGLYSALHQYSWSDSLFTILAFIGISIPGFFLALVVMYVLTVKLGIPYSGGLFAPRFIMAPWSFRKFLDFLLHFAVPVVIVGMAGMARNMRITRANLLDVLGEQYIQTARAKGLRERVVIYKHALRNSVQPLIMYFGMLFPMLLTGSIVVSIVLSLPTTGPMFYNALLSQDMYLAGSFILIIAASLVAGNLLADIALALVDPRVRYD